MEEKVKCKICGAMLKNVTNTHLKKHNLTISEYEEMFPGIELVSEKTRKTTSDANIKRFKDPEERKKMSNAQKKRWEDPEERKKASDATIKRYEDPEIRKKLSDAGIKRYEDPEERKKMSNAQKKRWEDPEERKKLNDAQKKRWSDPEERKKTSEAQKKRYEDPEERKKLSDAQKKRWEDPEEREKASDATIKRYEDPEIRKKLSDANIKRYEDPEERKKLSDAQKKRWSDPEERKRQSEVMSGGNAPNWKGGVSFGKYCPKFNKRTKREIRDKYNNCDFISGLSDRICNKGCKLDVHHVDYNKQQGCDDHEWRLIPLSKSNHGKTGLNRPFWNTLFTYALDYDIDPYNESPIDVFTEMRCNV